MERNIDENIINLLRRDFRILKGMTPQEHLHHFINWREKNKLVLETTEWVQSIIGQKGISLEATIRLLNRFSNVSLETQKLVLHTLLGNNRNIEVKTSFRLSSEGKLELSTTETYLYLKTEINDNLKNDLNSCYG